MSISSVSSCKISPQLIVCEEKKIKIFIICFSFVFLASPCVQSCLWGHTLFFCGVKKGTSTNCQGWARPPIGKAVVPISKHLFFALVEEFYSIGIGLQSRGKRSSTHGGPRPSHTTVVLSVRLYRAKQSATLFCTRLIFEGIKTLSIIRWRISATKCP